MRMGEFVTGLKQSWSSIEERVSNVSLRDQIAWPPGWQRFCCSDGEVSASVDSKEVLLLWKCDFATISVRASDGSRTCVNVGYRIPAYFHSGASSGLWIDQWRYPLVTVTDMSRGQGRCVGCDPFDLLSPPSKVT